MSGIHMMLVGGTTVGQLSAPATLSDEAQVSVNGGNIALSIGNDGLIVTSGISTHELPWVNPQLGMALFDARATFVSGTDANFSGGLAFNTWFNLSASREWVLSRSGEGVSQGVFDIDFAWAGATSVLRTMRVTLTVTASGEFGP
jgi:hypothetical protein